MVYGVSSTCMFFPPLLPRETTLRPSKMGFIPCSAVCFFKDLIPLKQKDKKLNEESLPLILSDHLKRKKV